MTCHFSTIFFWRCVPPFAQSTFMSFFSGTGTESVVDNIVKDIESSWKEIIYMCLVALGETISSFYFTIILMQWNRTLGRYIYCYLYEKTTFYAPRLVINHDRASTILGRGDCLHHHDLHRLGLYYCTCDTLVRTFIFNLFNALQYNRQ